MILAVHGFAIRKQDSRNQRTCDIMHIDGYQEFQKGTRPRCELQETKTGAGTERTPSQIPGSTHREDKDILEALGQQRIDKKGKAT